MTYQTLTCSVANAVARVSLNRPEVFNAFDSLLIEELTRVFTQLNLDQQVRVIVLDGKGKHFCSGADIHWMKAMSEVGPRINEIEAKKMSDMFESIANSSKPTVVVVHGLSLGGGTGLIAACDIAIGTQTTQMAFTEVRLGIVPAVISPYVFRAIGPRAASRYFQTGERFDAATALRLGLLHEVVQDDGTGIATDVAVRRCLNDLLAGAPEAQALCKTMIRDWGHLSLTEDLKEQTIRLIADTRSGEEAQQGFKAFFAKKDAPWVQKV